MKRQYHKGKWINRPKRLPYEPQPAPQLLLDGPSARFINMLATERQKVKEELATMRANFAEHLYNHSEPI